MNQPIQLKKSTQGNVETSHEACETQIRDLESQLKDQKNKYLYLYSDFEDFKRRVVRERSELIRFGWEPLALEFLQIIDNLERALKHLPQDKDHKLSEGLHMVLRQFQAVLEKQAIQKIESLGKIFDPNLHEVIAQEPSNQEQGTILKELSTGYTIHDRILRPAQVVVSSGNKPPPKKA